MSKTYLYDVKGRQKDIIRLANSVGEALNGHGLALEDKVRVGSNSTSIYKYYQLNNGVKVSLHYDPQFVYDEKLIPYLQITVSGEDFDVLMFIESLRQEYKQSPRLAVVQDYGRGIKTHIDGFLKFSDYQIGLSADNPLMQLF